MIRLVSALLILCATVLGGCATQQNSVTVAPAKEPSPRALRLSLSAHVPAVGLRWLLHLRPQKLLGTPGFLEDWSQVFDAEHVQAFVQSIGFEPQDIEEAWIAGYDFGVLYIFDGKIVGMKAEEAFRRRSLSTQEQASDFVDILHLTGIIGETPSALVHIDQHMVAIAVGDIQLARIVRAYAEGRLKKSPPALEARFLAPLAPLERDAPLRIFLLGPFEEATDAVANGFVSGVAAVDLHEGRLHVRAEARGAWPDDVPLTDAVGAWVDDVLSTREMRALGWGFPLEPPKVRCDSAAHKAPDSLVSCQASGSWKSAAIASALYRLTAGSMEELLAASPPDGWHREATTTDESPASTPREAGSAKDLAPINETRQQP